MTQNNLKIHAGLPQIGTKVDGRYELMGLLGRGGFGAVYLARQISMDRDVALKILLTQAVNMEEMVERFKREVMAIRNLSHPNTIQIYDFSTSEAGFLYYAMEAVKGPTLKHTIKDEGPIAPSRVKYICRQILKSLSEAHASRIVHRDLKPANIMLAEMHGEVDFVKVLDFGIAKLLDSDDGEEELTNAGVLIGTISYMSPEQISSQNIGPTTDIYALGLIGIEMLSGQSVFAKSGKWEILNKQISSDPIEVPEFVKRDPVGQIFMKAVSKNPNERYQSAKEMIMAFDQITACSGTPLIHRGWNNEVKAGIRASSISQSGPISVSGHMTNTPSQPVPISLNDLEEIPMTSSNLVLESDSHSFTSQQVSGFTNNTALSDSSEQKNKTPLILGVVVFVLLALTGAYFFLNGTSEEPGEPVELAKNEIKQAPPIEKAPEVETVEVEKIVEAAKTNKVRLSGPKGATLFDADNVQIGNLPLEISVEEITTYQIKAKGFNRKEITLSLDSEKEILVELEALKPEIVASKEKAKKPKPTPKTAEKPVVETKPNKIKPKPVKVKPKPKPADGWVPVKKEKKVDAWK